MSEVRNYPSLSEFKQLADADSEVRFVSKNNEMSGTGKAGAFFAGQNARVAAMNDFIGAIRQQYGNEVGNLAANLLAAPKIEGKALTGSMVKDVLAACANEQQRIAEYNRSAAGQTAPEAINQTVEELTAAHDLNTEGQETVRKFLEHNLDKAVKSLSDPVTKDNLQAALLNTTQKRLSELINLIKGEAVPFSSDLVSVQNTLKELPPLARLEIGENIYTSMQTEVVSAVVKEHFNDILNAAGPDGHITQEAIWKGLSGSDEVPADLALNQMKPRDFVDELINRVIGAKLCETIGITNASEELQSSVVGVVNSAMDKDLKFDTAIACLKGEQTVITLDDFTHPLEVSVSHFTKTLKDAESGLARDLARRGGWADGNENNRPFNSTISFENKKGVTSSINLSDPKKFILSDNDFHNFQICRPSSVSLQCAAHALDVCEGNAKQAAALTGALGQQSIIWTRYVSKVFNLMSPKQSIGEHSPANVSVKRLANGDISVSMHTLDPNKTYYSIDYLVKPDGSTPVTAMEMRAVPQQAPAQPHNPAAK